MAATRTCFVALCLLALVAPSFQAGTIYADFLTPVREDATFFEGISSVAVTVAGAEVGKLSSGNREGFFIESDGPIISQTGSVTINAAQLIDFTGHSETGSSTISSAGTLSMTGSHLDVDAGTFTGSGNAGSVSSDGTLVFQGGEMTIGNGSGEILFNATENDLSFGAAQGFSINADDGTVAFENGVAFASDIGGTSFTAVQGLNLLGNLVDIRSQNGASISTTGSQTYNAGSIVELRSDDAVALSATGDVLLEANSNFIEIDAASAAAFVAAGDITASADSISVVNEGSSESVFEMTHTGDIVFDAATTATFATFGSGDLGLEATNNVDLSGQNDVTMTVREVLDLSSDFGDVDLSSTTSLTLSSSLKNLTIAGDDGVSFASATSTIDLDGGSSIYATSQGGSVMATLGDISVDTSNFLLEQVDGNEQNSGNLVMNINGDFSDASGRTLFKSAGTTSFLAGSGSTASLDVQVEQILSLRSPSGPNDISFTAGDGVEVDINSSLSSISTETVITTEGDLTVNGDDLLLEVENVSTLSLQSDSNIFAEIDARVDIVAREVLSLTAEGSIDISSEDSGIFFDLHTLTVRTPGDVFFTSGDEFSVDAIVSINLEAEGDISFDSDSSGIGLSYDSTFTVTAETINFSSESFDVNADEIYFVANFPDDAFNLDASGPVDFEAAFGTVASGGDLIFSVDFIDAQAVDDADFRGFNSIQINAETGELVATNDLDFISAGALDIMSESSAYNFETMTIVPGPDAGNLGDGILLFDGDQTDVAVVDSYTETAISGDIIVNADNFDADANDFSVNAMSKWVFSADGAFLHVGNDLMQFEASLGATTDSVNYSVLANEDIIFRNLADTTITSDTFDFLATERVELTMRNFRFQASDFDVDVADDLTVTAGGDINYLANNQLTFTADSIVKTVGQDYNVRGDNTVTITDTTITYTGEDMVVNGVDFTTIDSEDDVVVDVGGEGEFFADLIHIRAGGDATFEATDAAGIVATAHDGEISFHQTGNFAVSAIGTTVDTGDVIFDATRSVRTEGELTFASDGRIDLGLGDASNPGVLAQTTSMDGNIVFDAVLGDVQVAAGSTFSGDALGGSFSLSSQVGQATTTQSAINWSAASDASFTAFDTVSYEMADDYVASLAANGARSNMESEGTIEFVARGTSAGPGDVVTAITVAEDMTISTSQQGGLELVSEEDLSIATQRESAYVSTNLFDVIVEEAVQFTATNGNIDVFTTGGPIDFESDDTYTTTSGRNTQITSGRDTSYASDGTQTITSNELLVHSITGATITDSDSDDSTFSATATVTIDSQGARTDPRDGVIMSAEGDIVATTPTSIVLNAFDQVIIGEQTRPDFELTLAGTSAVPGFVAVSDGSINFNVGEEFGWTSEGNVDITTTQEIAMISDQTLSLTAEGNGPSSDLRVQSSNGNVHFHADADTAVTATTATLTSTTGNFKITGKSRVPGSELRFLGDTDIESRSFLSNSGLLQSADGSELIFDGISAFTIASAVGSVGTVELNSADDLTVSTTADFEVRSLENDGGITIESVAGDIAIETITSGDIIFDASSNESRGLLAIESTAQLTISSVNSFTITANNPAHDDLRNGDIYVVSRDSGVVLDALDEMEFQTAEDFEIYADTLTAISVEAAFISSEDMIFENQGDSFSFVTQGDFDIQNSPESEGDFIIHAGSSQDLVEFNVGSDFQMVTGADWIGDSLSLDIIASGEDPLDQFGVRIQTEAVGGDIDLLSTGLLRIESVGESTFTTLTGDIRIEASETATFSSTDVTFMTGDTNMGGGDVTFTSSLASVRLLVDDSTVTDEFIEVFASGEDGQAGRLYFEANGIEPGSDGSIFFAAFEDSLVIATQGDETTEGNTVSFLAEEKFQLELNGVFAYFGALSDDFVSDPFNPYYGYGYNAPLFGSDPLQQTTSIEAHGLDADILFTSRESLDGPGELHIVTGLVDALGFQFENYYTDARDAQLTIIADGGSDAEIRFDVESGIIFRGTTSPYNVRISQYNGNYGSYLPESGANFVTLDPNADIELRTDVNAQSADIDFVVNDALFQSQDRSWYGTTGDYGGEVNMLVPNGDIRFTTRNNVNTDASPGIAINAYDSKVHISAELDGDVNFEAVRNVNVRADKGYLVDTPNLVLSGGNLSINSISGDVDWNTDILSLVALNDITFTTGDPSSTRSLRDTIGGDITFRTFDDLSLTADPDSGFINVASEDGGNIIVNFGSTLTVEGDTFVFGSMTFPMTQEDVRPGTFCNNLFQNNEVIISKQPLDVVSRRPDLYSKFGLSLCICNRVTAEYSCMSMSEFQY